MDSTNKPENIELWLEQLGQPSADRDYKPGHQRMHDLLGSFKLKKPQLRIRIAGTNGKGSTAFMLSNALQACGLNVGLYTSPHIQDFNERIRINDKSISDAELLALMDEMMPTALKARASYFEVATALALRHFSDAQVDVEILEAGVGARLDATTALQADMALITPVGLDHQAWLGNTLIEIAQEKSHITNECQFSISTHQVAEVMSILMEHCPTLKVAREREFPNLKTSGEHQQQNASLAWEAIEVLAASHLIDSGMLKGAKAAISNTRIPCRLQKVSCNRATLWLDAAHNDHAIDALIPSLSSLASPLDTILIFTRDDRNLSRSVDKLKPFTRSIAGERKHKPDKYYDSIEEALQTELNNTPDGKYLILGSFITVAAAQVWIDKQKRLSTLP